MTLQPDAVPTGCAAAAAAGMSAAAIAVVPPVVVLVLIKAMLVVVQTVCYLQQLMAVCEQVTAALQLSGPELYGTWLGCLMQPMQVAVPGAATGDLNAAAIGAVAADGGGWFHDAGGGGSGGGGGGAITDSLPTAAASNERL